MVERRGRFRLTDDDVVIEIRVEGDEPDTGSGSGGEIDPGELGVVGDVEGVGGEVVADYSFTIEAVEVASIISINKGQFLRSFEAFKVLRSDATGTIDPDAWGITVIGE